ncbi:hypothetical protein M9H77_13565 [Catharanthus roseus]|uniref:Uncharacterized protein n=1 Tax=Catharanthus roseus TaxID=4058 RepID=A0ACC0BKK0_CATRO|nr:hypothetical protein M9H77_13565 [Catharanthus roseus]
MADIYGAFFDFSCMLKSKVDDNDPNAQKTKNRLETILKLCRESGTLGKRKSYIMQTEPAYNTTMIVFILVILAILLAYLSANRPSFGGKLCPLLVRPPANYRRRKTISNEALKRVKEGNKRAMPWKIRLIGHTLVLLKKSSSSISEAADTISSSKGPYKDVEMAESSINQEATPSRYGEWNIIAPQKKFRKPSSSNKGIHANQKSYRDTL